VLLVDARTAMISLSKADEVDLRRKGEEEWADDDAVRTVPVRRWGLNESGAGWMLLSCARNINDAALLYSV
jgi:hypothetical protein